MTCVASLRQERRLSLAALLGCVFLFRTGQLLGMDDGLVDRAAGRPETGKLGIDAVALSLIVADRGFRADGSGVQQVDPAILGRAIGQKRLAAAGAGIGVAGQSATAAYDAL